MEIEWEIKVPSAGYVIIIHKPCKTETFHIHGFGRICETCGKKVPEEVKMKRFKLRRLDYIFRKTF